MNINRQNLEKYDIILLDEIKIILNHLKLLLKNNNNTKTFGYIDQIDINCH
jgi:hypothetical protein